MARELSEVLGDILEADHNTVATSDDIIKTLTEQLAGVLILRANTPDTEGEDRYEFGLIVGMVSTAMNLGVFDVETANGIIEKVYGMEVADAENRTE